MNGHRPGRSSFEAPCTVLCTVQLAPQDDGLGATKARAQAAIRNVTPPSKNALPATACPFALAACSTPATSVTPNSSALMISLAPFTKRNVALGNFSSASPL